MVAGTEATTTADHQRRRRVVIAAVTTVVVLAVGIPLVAWWRNRPVDVVGVVGWDGRACFGSSRDALWTTVGTVRPPGAPDDPFPATFQQTGLFEGVLVASGTSVLATTSPTTHDPRLAIGCAIR